MVVFTGDVDIPQRGTPPLFRQTGGAQVCVSTRAIDDSIGARVYNATNKQIAGY